MPKRKRAALFEVMSTAKPMERVVRSRGWLQSPSIWVTFKKYLARPQRPEPVQVHREIHRETRREIAAAPPVEIIEREPAPRNSAPREPRRPLLERLPFKPDWTNCVIAGSALVTVLGLALLLSHKLQREPLPSLSAVTTNDLRKQPARPAVLDIPRRATASVPQVDPAIVPTNVDLPENPAPPQQAKRIINMNYLMIQSFNDEKLTREAADMLNKNGVACTVIAGLPRWAPNPKWFCIVGMKGFGPYTTDTPDYQNYLQKIRQVSNTFAGKNKWKQFNPQLYRWGADSEK